MVRREHRRIDRVVRRTRWRYRPRTLLQGNRTGAQKAARTWAARFPGRFYLEVQRAGHADDDALVAATVGLAQEAALPVVATHPIQFLRPDGYRAHEARMCIAEGYVLADPRRPQALHARPVFQVAGRDGGEPFPDLPEALANSVEIAERCNFALPLGKNYLPAFPTPEGVTLDDHLRNEAAAGLACRLESLLSRSAVRADKRGNTPTRLDFETGPSCRWASPATS